LAFLELIWGRQLDMWRLVGTNSSGECRWSSPFEVYALTLPEDVEAMLVVTAIDWAQMQRLRLLLLALFAYRVDDDDVCRKLWDLTVCQW